MQNAKWLWSLAIRVRKLRESDFIFGLYTAKTDQKLDSLSFLTLRAFSVLQNTPAAMTDMPVLKAAMLWYLLPFKKLNLFFFYTNWIFKKWSSFVIYIQPLKLFRFLLSVATDDKDGHGLKLEEVGPTFSSFTLKLTKPWTPKISIEIMLLCCAEIANKAWEN